MSHTFSLPRNRMVRALFCFSFLILCGNIRAQADSLNLVSTKNPIVYEMDFGSGGILMQKGLEEITYKNSSFQGIHFRVGWKQYGKEDPYNSIYNNPIYGVGFFTSTFNDDVIGNPFAFYGFVQVPLHKKKESNWSYDYRIGLGLSGNFKPFDKVSNPSNLVIGSRTNVFIDLGFRVQYQFHQDWKAGLGLSFHHFSNGALALPNKGINLMPLSLSINYQPSQIKNWKSSYELQSYSKKWLYHINIGFGLKQLREDLEKHYLKSTVSFYASRSISHKWRMGGGVDIFYSDSGNEKEIAGDKSGKISSKLSGGPSFYLVHILNDRLVLNGNVGYYIHNQKFNGEIQKLFLRAGVRYYVTRNINAGVSIKAHMGKADFIEWTLGYTFNR